MKVVLFCGGLGLRLREYSEEIPKPMVPIGYRPILWHVMRYYAHFGHKEFVLCLGWKGDVIKQYFLRYNECLSNDFTLSAGGREIQLLNQDIDDWRITFVDTGSHASVGERLRAVRPFVADEPAFLANYADGLTDLHLPSLLEYHQSQQAVATMLCVRPRQSFHQVEFGQHGQVRGIEIISQADVWMNGGYFVFQSEIFDHLERGEDLVGKPFQRLIERDKLRGLKYDGFWGCMDTYKEKQLLDEMYARGDSPWEVWKQPGSSPAAGGELRPAKPILAEPVAAKPVLAGPVLAGPVLAGPVAVPSGVTRPGAAEPAWDPATRLPTTRSDLQFVRGENNSCFRSP